MLSGLLYSLITHDCLARYGSNSIINSADAVIVKGLITNSDEAAYGEEVPGATISRSQYQQNYHWLKQHPSTSREALCTGAVTSFKFPGVGLSSTLKRTEQIKDRAVSKRGRKRLGSPRTTWLPTPILKNFYTCPVESLLTRRRELWRGWRSTKQNHRHTALNTAEESWKTMCGHPVHSSLDSDPSAHLPQDSNDIKHSSFLNNILRDFTDKYKHHLQNHLPISPKRELRIPQVCCQWRLRIPEEASCCF